MKIRFARPLFAVAAARCCALSLLIPVALSGCGKDDGPTYASVKGKVTLDGQPVQSGTVLFLPQAGTEGGASSGTINRDGTFELVGPAGKGVVVGTHRVLVQCPAEGSGPDTGDNPLDNAPPCKIPAWYANERTSGIEKSVDEGENDIVIELSSKRKK